MIGCRRLRRARALVPAVLLVLLLGPPGQADELGRALELALARNPGLAAAGARVEAAGAAERVAYAPYLPSIDLSLRGGYGWEPPGLVVDGRLSHYWEGEARLELRQRLWDGGRRAFGLAEAEAETTAAAARRALAEEELARAVLEAWLAAAEASERAQLLTAAIADLRGLGRLIEQQIAGGLATTAERHQLASRLDLLAADLALNAGALAAAQARLQSLTGASAFTFVLPPFPAARLPVDPAAAVARALAAQPLLAESRALIEAGKAAKGAAEAAFWPTLDFVVVGRLAQHPAGLDDSREELLALLQLRWRLFDGYGRSALVDERGHRAAAAGYQLAERQRILERDMAEAFARLAMLAGRLPALNAARLAAGRTFQLYREQFGVGLRSLIDLVDARSELLQRAQDELDAEVERLDAAFDLGFALGELRIWLSEAPSLEESAAPVLFQLASAEPLVLLAPEPVAVGAAVATVLTKRQEVPVAVQREFVLSVAPAVAGKLGAGPGLAELMQALLAPARD
jgi:adhesin transport system outer membrane protein